MNYQNRVHLYVLGDNAVGKTFLIEKLINGKNHIAKNYKRNEFTMYDWIVSDNEHKVIVDIKEFVPNSDYKFDLEENSVILIILNAYSTNKQSQINSKILAYTKNLPKNCISILLINGNRSNSLINISDEIQKTSFVNIREVVWSNIANEDFTDFKLLLENIILNAYTNRLDHVRNIIKKNLNEKKTILDLGNCSLTNLIEVKEIFKNEHLEELILSNEWAEYKDGKWHKNTSINHGYQNSLGNFPIEIEKLKNLKILIAGGDWNDGNSNWNRWRIQNLKPFLKLRKLEYLNLSNNAIEIMPSLNSLKKIKILHLNNNYISKIHGRTKISSLEELYLSNNNISSVSFLSLFTHIKTVDLHGNNIKNIISLKEHIERVNITNSKWEQNTINIAKNPLEQPPMEIVNIGKEAVLSYFNDIIEGGSFINKDVKLILVGNSEVGKTTLAKYLNDEIGLDKEHLPTRWMDEKQLKSKHIISKIKAKCNIHLFDFGGHDYFHDTHHLFFDKNTVYLLLWDKQTNKLDYRFVKQKTENGNEEEFRTQDYPIKYWLDSIKYFTKEKKAENFDFEINKELEYNSHVLVVQNKVENKDDIIHLNNADLSFQYPFIYDFINISIKPRRNLDHLDYLITEMFNATEILGTELPKYYGIIKDSISNYDGNPIITIADFKKYCKELAGSAVTDERVIYLANYLKQIGTILYYPPYEKVYINKKWVIDKIHKILINVNILNGEFDDNHIRKVFAEDINEQEIKDIINLMTEFKMIFQHPQSNKYIAPLYLLNKPIKAVELFIDSKKTPYRRIDYTGFIHKNVILNFFQEYGKLVIKEKSENGDLFYYWKNGLIIKDPNSNEIVMIEFHLGSNEGNASIDIIKLNVDIQTNFVDEIIRFLHKINDGYEIEEMITNNGVDYIPLSVIYNNEQNKNWTFLYKDKYYKLSDFKKYLKNSTKMKNIFISYSKQDIALVNKFIEHLSALQCDGKISHWYCSELLPGTEWDAEIKEHFDTADIICFMVSPNLMKTQYIHEHEISRAFERKAKDPKLKIVPIILDYCRWTTDKNNLGKFTALPYTAKPVSDFNNPNMAWYIIEESLRLIIDEDIDNVGDSLYSNKHLPPAILKLYERIIDGRIDKNSLPNI